jgi:hypothetical protein
MSIILGEFFLLPLGISVDVQFNMNLAISYSWSDADYNIRRQPSR